MCVSCNLLNVVVIAVICNVFYRCNMVICRGVVDRKEKIEKKIYNIVEFKSRYT